MTTFKCPRPDRNRGRINQSSPDQATPCPTRSKRSTPSMPKTSQSQRLVRTLTDGTLDQLQSKTLADLANVLQSYNNLAIPTQQVVTAYEDFHKKVKLALKGKITWFDPKGTEMIIDQDSSGAALLTMLGEEVGKALGNYKLDKQDEEALAKIMRDHRTEVEEFIASRPVVMGPKRQTTVLSGKSTETSKLAGNVLQKRLFTED